MTAAADHQRIAELASDRSIHQAFSWLHLHELQMRRWQLEFVSVPAPPFGEGARSDWFARRFEQLGLRNVHVDDAGNALGELSGEAGSDCPVVLLSAHLDTVFPPGTECVPREVGSTIFCPGICDNGAGLTALLAMAAALVEAAVVPGCTLLFAANVGEEGQGDLRGMRHLFGASPYAKRISAAIALEGAGEATVVNRALGSRRIRLTISGPGGHSWADAGRPNPIVALSEGIVATRSVPLPSTPRTTLNWGTISGGTSVNSIPEAASAELDIRSSSSQQIDRAELAVLTILGRVVDGMNKEIVSIAALRLHAERIGERVAGELPDASRLAASLRAVDRHLSLKTEFRIGSTDANLPLSLGVPALAIGCGGKGGGMHTLGEWYDPAGRELALRRILLLLLDTCSQAEVNIRRRDASLLHSGS